MTLDQLVAAHREKQAAVEAAIRKGIAGHGDAMPVAVQCGDLALLLSMLDEARAAAPPPATNAPAEEAPKAAE